MHFSSASSGESFIARKVDVSMTTPMLMRVGVSGIIQNQRSSPRTMRMSVPSMPAGRSTFS